MIIQLIVDRLKQLIPALLGVALVTFLLVHLIPGDPVALLAGDRASPETIAAVKTRYGLDQPIVVQLFYYLKNIAMGDLGQSLRFRIPVTELILQHLWPTALLMIMTILITIPCAIFLAALAASHQDRPLDHAIRAFSVAGIAIPVFWIGIVLARVFSVQLGWFPVAGFGEGLWDNVYHLVLPSITLAVGIVPVLARNLRASLLEMMEADFVTAARSKGVPESYIFKRHVFMNALIPNLQLFGVIVAFLFGGTIVVEKVFAIPGIGQLLISSILGRDYYVVLGLTFFFAVFTMLVMLIVDLVSMLIDPRLRS
ncbi:ABC transporter permease [Ruegeria atlantica]|uniref:ABC transporter permease n=1 Tax=Ruegeria atlantica TaxID=81569 RepID=UPI00147F4DEC|nr:ABC transporter permease [Ruegeria atlantica]